MSRFASRNKTVQSIRKSLLNELDTTKIFVSWEDRDAKMVKMVIEADSTLNRERFNNIVGDKLPHGVFSYETHPSDRLRDWAETHVYFHA